MISIVLVLASISAVYGQVPIFASCPNVSVVENFQLEQYLGKWYEIQRYFTLFELGGACVTADYGLDGNGRVTVTNSQTNSLTRMRNSIKGIARPISRSSEAKLLVNFPSLPVNFDAPYWILGTDYDNYAVVWSCVDLGFVSLRFSWILTRSPQPTTEVLNNIYRLLDQEGIPRNAYMKTDQANCKY